MLSRLFNERGFRMRPISRFQGRPIRFSIRRPSLRTSSLILVAIAAACPALGSDVDDPPGNVRAVRIDPRPADDRTFVIGAGPGLDTVCTFRSGGPLIINIPVTRYAGPRRSDGTLQHPWSLMAEGLISAYAELSLPAFDVDFNASVTPPQQPERDRVFFNGEPVASLFAGNSEYLQGDNGIWRLNSFRIPIENVKFPGLGYTSEPLPAMNELRIEIDTANEGELWCTAVDWAELSIKIASPIIFVPGNGQSGTFFRTRGITDHLDAVPWLWDDSINMGRTTVAASVNDLLTKILPIVRSYGVDSVHIVAHSKGGLDVRKYLDLRRGKSDGPFRVLSLTTLGTPHNGSILADIAEARLFEVRREYEVSFVGFPAFAGVLTSLVETDEVDQGRPNLSTKWTAAFNAHNISRLPTETVYHAVGGDADLNGNGRIDHTPDEYLALRNANSQLAYQHFLPGGPTITQIGVNTSYQILRNTASIKVKYTSESSIKFSDYTVAHIESYPPSPLVPLFNDVLVTQDSALGVGTLLPRLSFSASFTGGAGRNHASIADAGVGATIVPWLTSVERSNGDLR